MFDKRKKPRKKAVHRLEDETAGRKELLHKSYIKPISLSSLKMLLGETLLFGDVERKQFWQFFEVELRQYICLRISQGGYCSGCGGAGTNNSR